MDSTLPPNDGSSWWKSGHPWLHESTGNSPGAWLASVELLTLAAKRVHDTTPTILPDGTEMMMSVNSVSAMLTGYAIEGALKGLWLRAGNKLIVNGKFKNPPGVGDHQLLQLAKKVSTQVHLPLTTAELNVLDRLSAFVLFAGRYPVPRVAEQMKPRRALRGQSQEQNFFTQEDFQIANRLLNAFTTALHPGFRIFKRAKAPKMPSALASPHR